MRVAIIGYSGAGRTTLANALAGVFGVRPIHALEDLQMPLDPIESLVLDGIPNTVDELDQIDAKKPGTHGIEHALYLEAPEKIRLGRIARMVVAGADPAKARGQMLHHGDLDQVRSHLESTDRLKIIDATRSRTEVLVQALEALGFGI